MRKLVTIRKIERCINIEGADSIELVKIDGWQCVAKKGEFKAGDHCVYFEIDSYLPVKPEFEFLRRSSFKKMGEEEGFRVKTARFMGQLSQGLALPCHTFVDQFVGSKEDEGQELSEFFHLGADLTSFLGVQKYEPPIPAELAGLIKGSFPGVIPKTDQERCQNLSDEIFVTNKDVRYEVTTKMDGTSFTGYHNDGVTGVCGRNWELQNNDSNASNTLVRMFVDSGLEEALQKIGSNYAVQGELMGPGIQKNREGLKSAKLFVFDVVDISTGKYLDPEARHRFMDTLLQNGVNPDMVSHVPIQAVGVTLSDLGITDVDGLLKFAEGPSLVHLIREGLVFKRMDGLFSFKAISNLFLLKDKD